MRQNCTRWALLVLALLALPLIGASAAGQGAAAGVVENHAEGFTALLLDGGISAINDRARDLAAAIAQRDAIEDPDARLAAEVDVLEIRSRMAIHERTNQFFEQQYDGLMMLADALRAGSIAGWVALAPAVATAALLARRARRPGSSAAAWPTLLALLLTVFASLLSLAAPQVPASVDTEGLAQQAHALIAIGLIMLVVAVELSRFVDQKEEAAVVQRRLVEAEGRILRVERRRRSRRGVLWVVLAGVILARRR